MYSIVPGAEIVNQKGKGSENLSEPLNLSKNLHHKFQIE